MSFKFVKIPTSIEETNFSYINNINDYYALIHVLNIFINQKIKGTITRYIFQNIHDLFHSITLDLEKFKNPNIAFLNEKDIEKYSHIHDKNKIILVKSENYNCFASYTKSIENNVSNLESNSPKTILYNISELETSGSISIIPSNVNIYFSSLIYAYTLLNSYLFYLKQDINILIQLSKIFYVIILSLYGRRSGLINAPRKEKEFLFFLTSSFVFNNYATNSIKSKYNLADFLKILSSNIGNIHLNDYVAKLASVTTQNDFLNTNYYTFEEYIKLLEKMNLITTTFSEAKIYWFKIFGFYGLLGLENYIRLVAYFLATEFPNSIFKTHLRVYDKNTYEYLIEYFLKILFSAQKN